MSILQFSLLLLLAIFFPLNSEITATHTPHNTVHCWIILQQQCRNHGHPKPFWKEGLGTKSGRAVGLQVGGDAQLPPCSSSSAIHQQPQWEFFLNECRAIFNLGTRCCSFVLVTLFMCGWRRPGEEGTLLLPDTSSLAPTFPSKGAAAPLPNCLDQKHNAKILRLLK